MNHPVDPPLTAWLVCTDSNRVFFGRVGPYYEYPVVLSFTLQAFRRYGHKMVPSTLIEILLFCVVPESSVDSCVVYLTVSFLVQLWSRSSLSPGPFSLRVVFMWDPPVSRPGDADSLYLRQSSSMLIYSLFLIFPSCCRTVFVEEAR